MLPFSFLVVSNMVPSSHKQEDLPAQYSRFFTESFSDERIRNRRGYVPLAFLMSPPSNPTELAVKRLMESCPAKATMSLVGGGLIGAFFGLFTASVDPMSTMTTETPSLKVVWRETRIRMVSYSKNFASIGFLFSGIECAIETYRGTHDLLNGTYAGTVTGFLLGLRAGMRPAMLGGVGFGAFSALIEYYLTRRHHHP